MKRWQVTLIVLIVVALCVNALLALRENDPSAVRETTIEAPVFATDAG